MRARLGFVANLVLVAVVTVFMLAVGGGMVWHAGVLLAGPTRCDGHVMTPNDECRIRWQGREKDETFVAGQHVGARDEGGVDDLGEKQHDDVQDGIGGLVFGGVLGGVGLLMVVVIVFAVVGRRRRTRRRVVRRGPFRSRIQRVLWGSGERT